MAPRIGWWNRPDGTLVRGLPATHRIMPYLMRGRNESAVYFEQRIALRNADAYVRAFNTAHPETPVTLQHLVMWATAQAMLAYPAMNRFVAGGRIYQRDGIWFTYSAKQSLKGAGHATVVLKRRFDPDEPLTDMIAGMAAQLREERFGGGVSSSDQEIELILKLPGFGRRIVMAAGRALEANGLFPRSFVDDDPLYASAFFANLASIGMDACYHHLYEYGTIGVFCAMGRATTDPGSPTSGPDRRRSMTLRWSFDERVADGLTAGYALKRAKDCLEDPTRLGLGEPA